MTGRLLIGVLIYGIIVALTPSVLGEGGLRFLTECFLMLVLAQMWNLLAGYGGLVSLGHQVFIGLGAYTVFIICAQLKIFPFFALPAAPILCGVVAAIVAIPLFRLREVYFAIGMWVFAEIVATFFVKTYWLGGTRGFTLATIDMIDFGWFEAMLFWIASSAAGATVVGIYLLLKSRFGLSLMSVRDNDRTAAHIGVNVQRNRFIAFVISGAGCGFAGAVTFLGNLFVAPAQSFDVNWVVNMLFIVIIGGIGTLEGPIIGTIIFFGLRQLITDVFGLTAGWYLVTLGAAAVVSMLFAPRGLWPLFSERFGIELLSVRRRPPSRISSPQRGGGTSAAASAGVAKEI